MNTTHLIVPIASYLDAEDPLVVAEARSLADRWAADGGLVLLGVPEVAETKYGRALRWAANPA